MLLIIQVQNGGWCFTLHSPFIFWDKTVITEKGLLNRRFILIVITSEWRVNEGFMKGCSPPFILHLTDSLSNKIEQ